MLFEGEKKLHEGEKESREKNRQELRIEMFEGAAKQLEAQLEEAKDFKDRLGDFQASQAMDKVVEALKEGIKRAKEFAEEEQKN